MANSVKYTVDGETVELVYPTVTVTQTPTPVTRLTKIASITYTYTIRCFLIGTTNSPLDSRLLRYRQLLSKVGGLIEIDYRGFQSAIRLNSPEDLEQGPHPINLNVEKFYGGNSALLTWQVQTVRFATEDDYFGEVSRWVDFAYTISTTLNQQLYATRVISGVLRINPNAAGNRADDKPLSPDAFRHTIASRFALPSGQSGHWQRVASNFRTSQDLLTLAFTITDKQRYAWLPRDMTGGNVEITTSMYPEGKGTIELAGYFVSHEKLGRADVHETVLKLLTGFHSDVIKEIWESTGSGAGFHLTEQTTRMTHRWFSNRVDFYTAWKIQGILEDSEHTEMAANMEFVTNRVVDWFGVLSRRKSSGPTNTMLDPYGTSQVRGVDGNETFAPIIDINFEDKNQYSGGTSRSGQSGNRSGGGTSTLKRASKQKYLYFKQYFSYQIDPGIVTLPVHGSDINAIVQRVKNPEIYLTVLGAAETSEQPPGVPLPPFPMYDPTLDNFGGGGEVTSSVNIYATVVDMAIDSAEPSANAEYKLLWRYILRLHNVPISFVQDISLRWPYSPMLPSHKGHWQQDAEGHKYFEFGFPGDQQWL